MLNSPHFGAVSCLNMLPYFFDNPNIFLTSTPKEVNHLFIQGQLHGACMSAYAGLKEGLQPMYPYCGVGSHADVGSVYLEPLHCDVPENSAFWMEWSQALPSCFGKARPPSQTPIYLFSHGASEQSLWMSKVFFLRSGLNPVTVTLPSGAKSWTQNQIKEWWLGAGGSLVEKSAVLMIGDDALFQAGARPALRFDIGRLWRQFAHLPPLFALWFCHSDYTELAQNSINKSLDHWHTLHSSSKLSFLRQHSPQSSEKTLEYMNNLSFRLTGEFESTVSIYKKLIDNPRCDLLDATLLATSQ